MPSSAHAGLSPILPGNVMYVGIETHSTNSTYPEAPACSMRLNSVYVTSLFAASIARRPTFEHRICIHLTSVRKFDTRQSIAAKSMLNVNDTSPIVPLLSWPGPLQNGDASEHEKVRKGIANVSKESPSDQVGVRSTVAVRNALRTHGYVV